MALVVTPTHAATSLALVPTCGDEVAIPEMPQMDWGALAAQLPDMSSLDASQ